jgi:biopolymer transport protein TolR
MGMSLGGGKSASGRHRSNSEINVTPMVDVMLVLLVIFMITAPTLKEGLAVDIPRATATQSINIEDAHLITVTEEGYVLKNKAGTKEERYRQIPDLVTDLKAYLKTCEAAKKKPTVVIVGDGAAKYERIVQVWNAVINAGVEQVSFQVEPGEPEKRL